MENNKIKHVKLTIVLLVIILSLFFNSFATAISSKQVACLNFLAITCSGITSLTTWNYIPFATVTGAVGTGYSANYLWRRLLPAQQTTNSILTTSAAIASSVVSNEDIESPSDGIAQLSWMADSGAPIPGIPWWELDGNGILDFEIVKALNYDGLSGGEIFSQLVKKIGFANIKAVKAKWINRPGYDTDYNNFMSGLPKSVHPYWSVRAHTFLGKVVTTDRYGLKGNLVGVRFLGHGSYGIEDFVELIFYDPSDTSFTIPSAEDDIRAFPSFLDGHLPFDL
ncbi:MAG: hypothetical protein ACI8VC_000403 [Candidatus Endobugula sp.]|jgi:hypothetical protein